MQNGKHKVFNFQMSKLDTKIINEKLAEVFNKLDSAAKTNIALGFVLRNIETGEYRLFYALENNTLFEKSHFLCTKADLVTIHNSSKSRKIWYCRTTYPKTSEHEMEIQVDHKCDNFCCFTGKHPKGIS